MGQLRGAVRALAPTGSPREVLERLDLFVDTLPEAAIEEHVATLPGLDGRKMSKSYGNAIGFLDAPQEMFGRVMSLSDDVMGDWFRLLTPLADGDEIHVGSLVLTFRTAGRSKPTERVRPPRNEGEDERHS